MEPRLTQSSKNSLSTSNWEIWDPPLSSRASKFTGIVPIVVASPSHRPNSSPICLRSMVWAMQSLSQLLSILELAYPPPCALRTLQKCLRCNITPTSHLLVPSCIWPSLQSQTLPMLPECLPDSTPILVWLTGKLQSMCFAIWRVQSTTNLCTGHPHCLSPLSLTEMLIMVEIQTMASPLVVLWWKFPIRQLISQVDISCRGQKNIL